MNKIYLSLYEELLTRQMYWLFHTENKGNMLQLVTKKSSQKCLKLFEEDPNFKMSFLNKFNEDLHQKGLFDQVVDIIINDKVFLEHFFIGKDKAKDVVKSRMNKSFKKLFNECSKEAKNSLGEIISKNLDFSSYFEYKTEEEIELYNNCKVEVLLKDKDKDNKFKDELVKAAFDTQKGNKLLLITFFAQKKVEEPGFLEELEKNYGVFLDVDNFIKEMNQKIKEIKTYKDLFNFIGTDFGKDKSDYDLIISAYEEAKKKGYIRTPNSLSNTRRDIRADDLTFSRRTINRSEMQNRNNSYYDDDSYSSRSRSISSSLSISRSSNIRRSRSRSRRNRNSSRRSRNRNRRNRDRSRSISSSYSRNRSRSRSRRNLNRSRGNRDSNRRNRH